MEVFAILILTIGIFCGFFVQTVAGFAGALVAMPILLFVMDLPDAVAYVSLFYGFSSCYMVYKEWDNIDKSIVKIIIIPSLIGLLVGVWILKIGNPLFLKKGLGIFIVGYVTYNYLGKKEARISKFLEFVFGFFGGFFSSVFAVGGPLYVIIIKNLAPNMKVFRATIFGVLGIVVFMRLPILAVTGVLNEKHLYYAMFVFPFFMFAIFLGKKLFAILDEAVLKKGILVLLLISGITLMFK